MANGEFEAFKKAAAVIRECKNQNLSQAQKQVIEISARITEAVMEAMDVQAPVVPEAEKPADTEVSAVQKYFPVIGICVTGASAGLGALLGPLTAAAAALVSGLALHFLHKKWSVEKPDSKQAVAPAAPEYVLDEQKLKELLKETDRMLVQLAENTQRPVQNNGYDILSDESFARWLQLFALHTHRSQDYNLLQMFQVLKEQLREIGLYIYDEIEQDMYGNVILPPDEDSFIDLREGEEWTKVTLPIVYTDKTVLMHGQIK